MDGCKWKKCTWGWEGSWKSQYGTVTSQVLFLAKKTTTDKQKTKGCIKDLKKIYSTRVLCSSVQHILAQESQGRAIQIAHWPTRTTKQLITRAAHCKKYHLNKYMH